VPPKLTAVAYVKVVPVTVTTVPPVSGPDVGETEVTVGAGAAPLTEKIFAVELALKGLQSEL
jgi:hypothetical protein